jgi:hypothetical protein
MQMLTGIFGAFPRAAVASQMDLRVLGETLLLEGHELNHVFQFAPALLMRKRTESDGAAKRLRN